MEMAVDMDTVIKFTRKLRFIVKKFLSDSAQ